MGKSLIMTGVSAKDFLCVSKSDEAWCVSTRLEYYAASHQPVSIYSVSRVSTYKSCSNFGIVYKATHSKILALLGQ